jgi:aminocarboxymuconate-semialdehyde decarboxylase
VIDVHAHYLSPALITNSRMDVPGVGFDTSTRQLLFPSGPSRPVHEPLLDLETRATSLARRGIRLQVLSPWLDVAGDDLPPGAAAQWTAMMNDATAAAIDGAAVYAAFAALPVTDGAAAARELRRSVTELGFRGGAIPTQVGGANLDEADLDPLFVAAEELAVPLFIHPHRVLGAERLRRDFLTNVCGNPFETTVAALSLFAAGVMDRHPDLAVLLAHCGGTLPVLAGRAAQASHAGIAERRTVADPDEILHAFHYDTVVHDPAVLGFALARLGPDRILLGTDDPYPMCVDDPADLLRRAGAAPDVIDQVTCGNAQTLLQLS